MFRCSQCGRLWPAGSKYCGRCQATLGVVTCKEGHESPLGSTCCTTCGSKQLSKGVSAANIRPVVRLAVFAGLALGVFLALGPALNLIQSFFACLANWLLPPLISLGVLSIFLASILGEKGKQQIVSFWIGLLGAILWILGQLGRLIVTAIRPK